jgi:exopolyphosphatase / guanosine-5'-triphosphate,3'-diphosphate pyrophosphatase
MKQPVASIDLGSHTARLLIARRSGSSRRLRPLVRKRAYIRLAEGFERGGEEIIGPDASARVLEVIQGFSSLIAEFNVRQVYGVATGIIRDAINRDQFLDHIYEQTNIKIGLISGKREALLSGKGALSALNIKGGPFLVFDLGGGTTEFFYDNRGKVEAKSVSLGAATLTKEFIRADPPDETELNSISKEIEKSLTSAHMELAREHVVIGTGGSVTTLAAMLHRIPVDDISPERVNGLKLTLPQVAACFEEMRNMNVEQRVGLSGLDSERANVIVAGALAVVGIMKYLGALELIVSMSDLLEGLLIDD